jgi:hypothetical protein
MRTPRFSRLARRPALAALLAPAILLAAGPAARCAAAAAGGPGFAPHRWPGGPLTDSGNWAGYAVSGGTFKTITGSWTEPQATCRADHDLVAPWLGLDGDTDFTVEQTGAAISCASGQPKVEGWYELYPNPPHYYSNPASPGDKFTATVTNTSGSTYKLTLTDVTQGWTQTVTKVLYSGIDASAEAILEAPGGFPSLPGGVTFTGVTVDGKTLGSYRPAKLTSDGFTPGPLTGGDFTITHK